MKPSVRTFTLERGALRATVIDLGATLTSLEVPDRDGRRASVVLGFADPASHGAHRLFLGTTVGRVANRIAGGRFVLGGREYRLPTNDGQNHLHGGFDGFDRAVWRAERIDANTVGFALTSPDGDQGYPGTLDVGVTYTLEPNGLRLDYEAVTDRATPVNLTNHSYFNLAGAGDVLGHELEVAADFYTPVDATVIPTGEIVRVAGTPFDFTRPHALSARFAELTNEPRGYDHNFVLRSAGTRAFAARLSDPGSGRVMEVHTTEPGLQLYTGNYLTGARTGGFARHAGVCLETQRFPDAVHHAHFPSVVLEPGATLRSTTIYAFGTAAR
jgi:aldose 1-epimerase